MPAEPQRSAAPRASDVAIYAPTGRDGALAAQVFARWEIDASTYDAMGALCAALGNGGIGVIILAEEGLTASRREELLAALDAQPAWSDVPIVVLTAEG